uniref:Xeroderma pigmentosum group C n=1 Tax=Hydra vulgaris TaxID=6087 RepID=G8H6N6_HYDVU|nr:xeroderma pigmentosum group C [Hydra vulgaris]
MKRKTKETNVRAKQKNDLPEDSRRRSSRKIVNYAENNEEESSESDFEPVSKKIKATKIKTPRKNNTVAIKPVSEPSTNVQILNITNLHTAVNLSEDESSSDDDVPLSAIKSCILPKVNEANNFEAVNSTFIIEPKTEIKNEIKETLEDNKVLDDKKNSLITKKAGSLKNSKTKKSIPIESLESKKVQKTENNNTKVLRARKENKLLKIETSKSSVEINKKKVSTSLKEISVNSSKANNMKFQSDTSSLADSEEENWEEVEEIEVKSKSKKMKKEEIKEDNIKLNDLEISVGVSSIHKKKLTRQEKYHNWVRQLIGRFQRELQQHIHKVHLLCLFACEIKRNMVCNIKSVQAICLSLVPLEFTKILTRQWNINHLRKFIDWYQKEIPSTEELLLFTDKATQVLKHMQREYILVIMLRSLGFLSRIICSLQPCTHKVFSSKSAMESNEKPTTANSKPPANSTKSPYFDSDTESSKLQKKSNLKSKNTNKKCNDASNTPNAKKKNASKKKKRKAKSSEDEEDKPKQIKSNKKSSAKSSVIKKGADVWIEVYLLTIQKWICIELTGKSIDEPDKCELYATNPLQYVIGIDNYNKVKDLTCRYAAKWLSFNRKLRVDRDWWFKTLAPYKPIESSIDSAEDAQLTKNLLDKDFPKTISDFKDNPLYALKRHLLKFQAIYPESAVPLGYIRNEAIYSRDCIRELHTRETWMKQAKVVKPGEIPYKVVKGRPKRNTPVFERENVKVEVFGEWQTEDYISPPVVNGIVPKNAYGNVELFKPCMLPEGAVHLPMANMQKIARKLKVDHAPAMMGWDFHGGFSHPVFEGIVVAKEHEDLLLDAWRREEELLEKKEKEKREKVIYENWKTLIKGLLIQNKLKLKYKFEDDESAVKKQVNVKKQQTKSSKSKKSEATTNDEYTDLSVSWPMNRMTGISSLQDEGHTHVFKECSNSLNKGVKTCSCGLTISSDKVEDL